LLFATRGSKPVSVLIGLVVKARNSEELFAHAAYDPSVRR